MTETLSCATVLFFWTVVQSNLLKAVNEQQLVMHVRQEGEYLNLVEKATCDECCTAFLTVILDGTISIELFIKRSLRPAV